MSFAEAYSEMRSGKKVKRPNFKGYWFIDQETGIAYIHLPDGKDICYGKLDLTIRNCAATDWVVVEEEQ